MRDGGTHLIHLCLSLLQTAVAGEIGRLLGGSTLRGSSGRGRPMKREIFGSLDEDIAKNSANKPLNPTCRGADGSKDYYEMYRNIFLIMSQGLEE